MPATGGALSPQKISTAERDLRCLRLRRSGESFEAIAKAEGFHDKSGARKAVERALKKSQREAGDEFRELEGQRYDEAQLSFWQEVLAGNLDAIRVFALISKERRGLFGLDKPGKLALTNPEGTAEYGSGNLTPEQQLLRARALVRAYEAEIAAARGETGQPREASSPADESIEDS